MHSDGTDLHDRCDQLRALHRPGAPLLLPNAWDVATARAVVAAGFPVVATTSGGVAGTLGYEDHEGAPGDEMLAAAARIARGVNVPVTVDAEAGYKMEPAELVAALRSAGRGGLQPRGHRPRSRDPPRPRRARRLAPRGAAGRVRRRLPARDQRPGRRVPRSVLRRRRTGIAGSAGSRSAAARRTPTSTPASIACTRSACGKRTRCARSSPRSADR